MWCECILMKTAMTGFQTTLGYQFGRIWTDQEANRVENLRPGAMEKLGIGYETLKNINPRIIVASTSGTTPTTLDPSRRTRRWPSNIVLQVTAPPAPSPPEQATT